MKSQKPTETQPSREIAMLQVALAQKDDNRIKRRLIEPTKTHTANKMPKLMFIFDTEADIEQFDDGSQLHTLRFGYGQFLRYNKNELIREPEPVRFETVEELYNIIEGYSHQGHKLYCFAHNLGYDWSLTGLSNCFTSQQWETHSIMDRKFTTVIRYSRGANTVEMIDTLNYWKMPLAEIAKNYGLEKGTIDYRYNDQKEADDYCKNDVYILTEALKDRREWILKNNYGSFKATNPSQSLAIFKQKYLKEPILTNQGEHQKELERRAYYGGRTDAAYIGFYRGKVTSLDINSAYPSVMVYNKFPCELIKEIKNPTKADLEIEDDKHCIFAQVTLDTNKAFYPYRDNERLIFPIGRFKAWLCEPEINLAMENKHLLQVNRLYLYKARPLFTEYVNDLHRKRREAIQNDNTPDELSYKLLLNSLYGKFGEHRKEWTAINVNNGAPDGVAYEANGDKREIYKVINYRGVKYKYVNKASASHSFPLISAFVTSYLRVKLCHTMELAGSHNWLYCDTDSLYVTDNGLRNLRTLIDDKKLGRWKVEGTSIGMEIRGLKDYIFGNQERIKGVSKDAEHLGDNTYKMMHWQTMHETICDDLHGSVRLTPIVKKLERAYHKGIVTDSGWVEPIEIEEFN